MNIVALLKSPIAWGVAGLLAAVLAVGVIYHKGEVAGAANVTAAVEHTTNLEIEKARKDRDAADEKVRIAPPDVVIDATR
jgi:hypothetical protein